MLHVDRAWTLEADDVVALPVPEQSRPYPSLSSKMVSGCTPSYFIASAASPDCKSSWKASMSGISKISLTRFEPCGSWNVRCVMPLDPKAHLVSAILSQWSTSSTPWNTRYVVTSAVLSQGEMPCALRGPVSTLTGLVLSWNRSWQHQIPPAPSLVARLRAHVAACCGCRWVGWCGGGTPCAA